MKRINRVFLTLLLLALSTASHAQHTGYPPPRFKSVEWNSESDEITFSLTVDTPAGVDRMDILLLYKDIIITLEEDAPISLRRVSIRKTFGKTISGDATLLLVYKATAKEGEPSKKTLYIESDNFLFASPFLKISSVSYDDQENNYILDYDYSGINTASGICTSLVELNNNYETIEDVTATDLNDETIRTIIVNADNLIEKWIYPKKLILVISGVTNTKHPFSDQKLVTFNPTLRYRAVYYIRLYWHLFVVAVLAGYFTIRQIRWYRGVHTAPFAVLPNERICALKRRTELWQWFETLKELHEDIEHPTEFMRYLIRRVEGLEEMPSSIEKLVKISEEISQIRTLNLDEHSRISRHFDAIFFKRHSELLIASVSDLAEDYWNMHRIGKDFECYFVSSKNELMDSLIKSMSYLNERLRTLLFELNPHASMFTRPTEAPSYQYLTKIQLEVNQAVTDLSDNFQRAETAIQGVHTQIESLITAIPKDDFMLSEAGNNLNFLPTEPLQHPLALLFGKLQAIFVQILEHLHHYRTSVIQRLLNDLGSIKRIEDISEFDKVIERIETRNFGDYLDTAIIGLEGIANDVSSALAQTPQSYGRRLSLQDVHIATRDLYARLLPETPKIAIELQRIATLFEENNCWKESNDEKNVYFNPYITGNPLQAKNIALFKGRVSIASDLVNRLRGMRNSTILLRGARRMGKSSFLYHLENLLPSTYISVFVDCQGAATEKESNFFYKIARNTYDVLRKRNRVKGKNLSRPRIESFSNSPAFKLEEWLTDEVGPIIGDRVLLVTLDEYESIGNAIRNKRISIDLLNNLRHLIQHNQFVTFMFAGVATLDTLVDNAASYFISVSTVELSYLNDAAAAALIRRPLDSEDVTIPINKKGIVPQYDEEAVKSLMTLTRNQPFLIQAMCEQLVNVANDRQLEKIKKEHVDEVASHIHKDYPNYFEFFLDNWRKDGQRIFANIVHGKLVSENHTEVVDDMIRHRVIERLDSGELKIEVPLMETFIRTRVS